MEATHAIGCSHCEEPAPTAVNIRGWLTAIAAGFVIVGCGLSWFTGLPNWAIPLFLIATVVGAVFPAQRAWQSITRGTLDINVLMVIAVAGAVAIRDWGLAGDVPVAADFDGDGKADVAVFRRSLGRWLITSSVNGTYQPIDWGLSSDVTVPADYDGDGKADVAVFRPSNGTWYVRGQFTRSWGLNGDVPALKRP